MSVDRRCKNVGWKVLDERGNYYTGSYEGSMLAVLMDIRDELQTLNATMACANTRSIPKTLREIRAAVRRLPVRKRRST